MIFHSGENLQFLVKVLEAQRHHTLLNPSPSIPEGLSIEHAQQCRQAQTLMHHRYSCWLYHITFFKKANSFLFILISLWKSEELCQNSKHTNTALKPHYVIF